MQPFTYARPTSLTSALAIFESAAGDARVLAGGTDLIIALRHDSVRSGIVVDIKRIPEVASGIAWEGDRLRIGATTVMATVASSEAVRDTFPALAEAAACVGSVQIRNRATVAGNVCNASPAADTAPPLLVYAAEVVASSVSGTRRIPIGEFFVRSGVTTLHPDEIVTAIELPRPARAMGVVHMRRTRRRGHDLASVTMCCGIDDSGVTRLAFGSVGPRPLVRSDVSGVLADVLASEEVKMKVLDDIFRDARPSPPSMRARPEYRLAMLRVLGLRGVEAAAARLAGQHR